MERKISVNGQEIWFDFERFKAEKEWMDKKEKEALANPPNRQAGETINQWLTRTTGELHNDPSSKYNEPLKCECGSHRK